MHEPQTKRITRFGLTITGLDVYFPKKETAIKIGKMSLRMNLDTKLFEEYRLWWLELGEHPRIIDEQRFDRTFLRKKKRYLKRFLFSEFFC